MKMYPDQLAPRVGAQASADRTGIGGWFLHVDQSGQIDVKASKRWFSLEITRDEWPWVFEKSSKPALIISTLEALAVLVALKKYYGEEPTTNRSSIRIVPTMTDNRGNGAALNKLMTTRYPASAVLMELAAYSKKMGLRASVEWSLGETNREADALANGDLILFAPELRIPVSSQHLQWSVLTEALAYEKEARCRCSLNCSGIGRNPRAYKYDVYLLPKQLHETLHVPALGAALTVCAQEQAPFKRGTLPVLSCKVQSRLMHLGTASVLVHVLGTQMASDERV